MFHFSRRTLWIIIYVTIPLIYILNSLGPDDAEQERVVEQTSTWSLDEVQVSCEQRMCVLPLADSSFNQITVISSLMPTTQMDVPQGLTISVGQQGGQFLSTVKTGSALKDAKAATRFIRQWLPSDDSQQFVLSGSLDDDVLSQFQSLRDLSFSGTGVPYQAEDASALGLLSAPATGSPEQLPFLMWIEVLKSRLAGYDVKVQWDHRRETSYVMFNSTLSEESFSPVEVSELDPILEAYVAAANVRERSAAQMHRYAIAASVYQLPFEFFTSQPERLKVLTLAAVNNMRELTLAQIQK